MIRLFLFSFLFTAVLANAQVYPLFGQPKNVTITGLTFDAMEPFISDDENTLFFNSLNSGGNTNLYYATRLNDTTFTYIGLVNGCYDPSPGHLDAVASLDSTNNFIWVSLRNYPAIYENLHRGTYAAGTVSNIGRVYGDFYVYTPGWLIMDAAINYQGNLLYYTNAFFNSCSFGMPCEARLGVAQKANDSTFNKLTNTDVLFANVNDTNYILYAPQVTHNGLELYFTRIQKTTVNSELCVSVRNDTVSPFSTAMVIYSNNGFVPEAATLTNDNQKMYYHEIDGSGMHSIYMRNRIGTTGIQENKIQDGFSLYPNPASDQLFIRPQYMTPSFTASILSLDGRLIFTTSQETIDVSRLPQGIYSVKLVQDHETYVKSFIKQ